jgi:hypothetical protein
MIFTLPRAAAFPLSERARLVCRGEAVPSPLSSSSPAEERAAPDGLRVLPRPIFTCAAAAVRRNGSLAFRIQG